MSPPVVRVAVPLPVATAAEEGLAGCAVATTDAAPLALRRGIRSWHFYDERCWRAIAAAVDAPGPTAQVCDCIDLRCEHATLERRIAYVSAVAGVDAPELRRWAGARAVMVDSGGGLARRVIAAAERRHRVAEALEAVEAIA